MRMKVKQTICTALCALLVLWSCNEENWETPRSQNNELPENAIGFSVLQSIVDELPTRADDITIDNFKQMTVYAHNTGTTDFDASASTSTPNVMYNQSVTKDGSGWTYTPPKYWPDGDPKISFFAIAPDPTVPANGIAIVATNNSYTGYPKFIVTPPANPVSQKDIVVTSAMNRKKDDGAVPLIFNHAMAKVDFSASYVYSGSTLRYARVTRLQLKNVLPSGTLTITNAAPYFSWSAVTGTATTYTLSTGNGALSGANLEEAGTGTRTRITSDTGTLMLVPQEANNVSVQLTVEYNEGSGDKSASLETTITAAKWNGGEQTTYNLKIDLDKLTIVYRGNDGRSQWDFTYTGGVQAFIAPKTGNYYFQAWGAQGGDVPNATSPKALGGKGGYAAGSISLTVGQKVYVYVGNAGVVGGGATFNGGGSGGRGVAGAAASGGGATDFRLVKGKWNNPTSLNSRIIVAGGGGGAEYSNATAGRGPLYICGGHASGAEEYRYEGGIAEGSGSGSIVTVTTPGGGGSGGYQRKGGPITAQIATYMAEHGITEDGRFYSATGTPGKFGVGGDAYREYDTGSLWYGGGGGGGWYGGAAGGIIPYYRIGGGGGSTYVTGLWSSGRGGICYGINPTSYTEPRAVVTQGTFACLKYLDSEFGPSPTWTNNTQIVASNYWAVSGGGYVTYSQQQYPIPNPITGKTGMLGNSGNGYARIRKE